MTYTRHLTFSALSLLLLSGCQNTTAYMTPGEVFTELDVEESAPSQQPAATTVSETPPAQEAVEPAVMDDTTTTPAPAAKPTTTPAQDIEEEKIAPEDRRFYRKGEEYEQAEEPEVILPTEPDPVVPTTPAEVAPESAEEQAHSAAPEEMQETPEPESMEPTAAEKPASITTQLMSGTLPWLIGAVALGGVVTVLFLRKKKGLPREIAAEQIAPPPPTQEQQASKRLEAAMEAMHAQDTTRPAAGSDAPAA